MRVARSTCRRVAGEISTARFTRRSSAPHHCRRNCVAAIHRSSVWRMNSVSLREHCNANSRSSALHTMSCSTTCAGSSQCVTCASARWRSAKLLTCSASPNRAHSIARSNVGPASPRRNSAANERTGGHGGPPLQLLPIKRLRRTGVTDCNCRGGPLWPPVLYTEATLSNLTAS